MYNKIVILILSGLLTFLGTKCTDCDSVRNNLLTEQQTKQNPYKGTEKIIFKSDHSYIEFIGKGREKYTEEWSIATCENELVGFDEMELSGSYYEIYLEMQARDFFEITLYDTIRDIYMKSKLKIDPTSGQLYNYNEYIDSLNINSSIYYDIYKDSLLKFHWDSVLPDTLYHATYIYYSTAYGIVKIDFSDSTSLELESIEW